MPEMSISLVWGSRPTVIVGSSSRILDSAAASLSSSPLDLGSSAKLIEASGIGTAATRIDFLGGHRVSPVWVSLSLGTAPMSPGASSVTCSSSLPWITDSAPRRSVTSRLALVTVASEATPPESTRSSVIRPV